MKTSKILKIIVGSLDKDSRDKREISVIRELGHEVFVLNKGFKNETIQVGKDLIVINRKVRDYNALGIKKTYQRISSVLHWIIIARKCRPDVISGHDLSGLTIAWLSTLYISKKKRPRLVYDSHEFEIGRNTNGKRSKLAKLIITRLERFLMKKCAFSIMVNDSIADEVQRIHKLEEKPVVVRNIPNYWEIDKKVCCEKKKEICQTLGVPVNTFMIMYHGGIIKGRGIEKLLLSIQKDENIIGIILGNGEESYIEHLKEMAIELQVSNRVLFHKAVPIDILWQYVGAADVGITLASNTCLNHYYMLPNKLFENIQSLTPIIGSNFPEITKIVEGYDIGLLVDPENIDEIANAIEQMRTNKKMYNKFKENLIVAKEELCWENESKVLEAAYEKILR